MRKHIRVIAVCLVAGALFVGFLGYETWKAKEEEPWSDLLYGCQLLPQFEYQDQTYFFAVDADAREQLPSGWSLVEDTVSQVQLPEHIEEEAQGLHAVFNGCSIWENKAQEGILYLQKGTEYCLFVSDTNRSSWIYYSGERYLYVDDYCRLFEEDMPDSLKDGGTLPDTAVPIGDLVFQERYQIPDKELHTNSLYLTGYAAYYDATTNVVYIAVPKGSWVDGETVTRYNKYLSVSMTADIQDMDVSSAMTFEELVSGYAELADIPYEKALKYFPVQAWKVGAVYRTLSIAIEVSESYHPTLNFYCETQEGTSSWGVTSIYAIQLNRKDGSRSMQFAGNIQTWLRDAYKIEYVVNGDFYKNGTTTVGESTGGGGDIGDLVQISYQASSSSDHYAYCYVHETKAFQ